MSSAHTMAADCAITGVVSAVGGAVIGAGLAGLMISSMGILSMKGGGPLEIDGDMNCSKTFNIKNISSSCFKCSALDCTDYSIFVDGKIK